MKYKVKVKATAWWETVLLKVIPMRWTLTSEFDGTYRWGTKELFGVTFLLVFEKI